MESSPSHSARPSSEDHTRPDHPSQCWPSSPAPNTAIAGSYFPSSSLVRHASYTSSPARSAGTPGDRPRPAPLSIPVSTPDEPIFSAYPDTGIGQPQQVCKFDFPLLEPFSLAHPPPRRQAMPPPPLPGRSETGTRRRYRATSLPFSANDQRAPQSHLPADPQPQPDAAQSPPDAGQASTRQSHTQQRPRSLAGHEDVSLWQSFPSINPEPIRPPCSTNADAQYTVQQSSRTLRAIGHTADMNAVTAILGLTHLDTGRDDTTRVVAPQEETADPPPPARRASLDDGAYTGRKASSHPHHVLPVMARDDQSLRSSFVSTSSTSTPSSSVEHPLSSTHTSLSRSTKSGKDRVINEETETILTAVRLQRSIEWEAKQKKRRSRLEQRRGVILELVETELNHTAGLKKLIHVYLPTLCRTFVFQESTWLSITRNIDVIYDLHERILSNMINVLKEEGIGYGTGLEPITEAHVDRAARRVVKVLIDEIPAFDAVYAYSAGASMAENIISKIRHKSEYLSFERLCGQSTSSLEPEPNLEQILQGTIATVQSAKSCPASPTRDVSHNRSRLKFEDHLILPIQRVCRYPLLLATLNRTLTPLSPDVEHEQPDFSTDGAHADESGLDINLAQAHEIMAQVAKQTDDARRVRDEELKSHLVIQRLESHPLLPASFLYKLGSCMLIAAFDVLYSHQTSTTITPANKPKYWATFVYRGFIVFAKVKRPNAYEPKHFFPLETSTIVYVEDGSLPFSVRIAIGDHFFDIGCSCKAEKDFLSETLSAAREEVDMTPFEMPSSISAFTARTTRRMSSVQEQDGVSSDLGQGSTKRHTLAVSPVELDFGQPRVFEDLAYLHSPVASSPTRTTFPFTNPDKRLMSSTSQKKPGVWVKLPNSSQRETVDEAMMDIFSIKCAKIRRGHGLNHVLFFGEETERLPSDLHRKTSSIGAGSLLRRRKSLVETRQFVKDITFVGEVRGSVIPARHSRSVAGHRRHGSASTSYSHAHSRSYSNSRVPPSVPPKRFTIGDDESTESETVRGATSEVNEETLSDFGALPGRALSSTSLSPTLPLPPVTRAYGQPVPAQVSTRKSLSSIRRGLSETAANDAGAGFTNLFTLARRKTTTAPTDRLGAHSRAKSVPGSPVGLPTALIESPSVPVPAVPRIKTKRSMSTLSMAGTRPVPMQMSSILGSEADDEASADSGRPEKAKSWTNLRRSMSLMFDKGSKPWSGAGDVESISTSGGGVSRTASSAGMTGMSGSDEPGTKEDKEVDGERLVSEKGEPRDSLEIPGGGGVPKRKRSLRAGGVLGPFARFTPM